MSLTNGNFTSALSRRAQQLAILDYFISEGTPRYHGYWIDEGEIYVLVSGKSRVLAISEEGALALESYPSQVALRDVSIDSDLSAEITWLVSELEEAERLPPRGVIEHIPQYFEKLLRAALEVGPDLEMITDCLWRFPDSAEWRYGNNQVRSSYSGWKELEGNVELYLNFAESHYGRCINYAAASYLYQGGEVTLEVIRFLQPDITQSEFSKDCRKLGISIPTRPSRKQDYKKAIKQMIAIEEKVSLAYQQFKELTERTSELVSAGNWNLAIEAGNEAETILRNYPALLITDDFRSLSEGPRLERTLRENLKTAWLGLSEPQRALNQLMQLANSSNLGSRELDRVLLDLARFSKSIGDVTEASKSYHRLANSLVLNCSNESELLVVREALDYLIANGSVDRAGRIAEALNAKTAWIRQKEEHGAKLSEFRSRLKNGNYSEAEIIIDMLLSSSTTSESECESIALEFFNAVKNSPNSNWIRKAVEVFLKLFGKIHGSNMFSVLPSVLGKLEEILSTDQCDEKYLKNISRLLEVILSSVEGCRSAYTSRKAQIEVMVNILDLLVLVYRRLSNESYAQTFMKEKQLLKSKIS